MRHLFLLLALAAPAAAAPATPSGVGTVGPAEVATSAADGSWVVLCQARKDTDHDGRVAVGTGFNGTYGDEQEAYLVVGSGPGERIDDLYGVDPTGERVIVARKHRTWLLHPGKERDVDITALGGAGFLGGKELVYSKKVGKATRFVVRDIASGHERELDAGPGEVYSYTDVGGWLEMQVLEHKPGDKPWVVDQDHAPKWCWTGALSDSITQSGTPPVWRYVPIAGGKPRSGDDIVGLLGDHLVRRMADRSLVLEAADSSQRELVPSSCSGWIMAADEVKLSVVVACKDGALFEYGAGKPRAIGAKVPLPSADWLHPGRFLFLSGKDGASTLVDTATGAMRDTGEYQQVMEVAGTYTFIQRGEKLVVLGGASERVLGAIAKYPETHRAGHYMYIEPLVVDLDAGTLVGHAPSRDGVQANVKAIANDGRLLVGFGGTRWELAPGPLEWVQPVP